MAHLNSQPRSGAARTAPTRALLFSFMLVAMVAAVLPSLVPASVPDLRVLVWLSIAVVAGGLGLALSTVPATRSRWLLLGAGWLLVLLTTVQAFLVGDLLALLGLWLAVPALALLAGQLRHRARKALMATHAVASACWIGIAVTMVAMSVIALTSRDPSTMLVTYQLMETFDISLLPWANFAATLSGFALGLTTKWGLLRHYWVAVKLAISLLVLVLAFGFLHDSLTGAHEDAERLAMAGDTAGELGSLPVVVLGGFGFALVNLVVAMLLSLYKPWGRTKRGAVGVRQDQKSLNHNRKEN